MSKGLVDFVTFDPVTKGSTCSPVLNSGINQLLNLDFQFQNATFSIQAETDLIVVIRLMPWFQKIVPNQMSIDLQFMPRLVFHGD
jgi:hypothetical protein